MSILKKRKVSDLDHKSEETKNFLLNTVKSTFEPKKYQSFLRIVTSAIRSGKTHESLSLMSRKLQILSKSHPDLVLGINRFLPHSLQIPSHNLDNAVVEDDDGDREEDYDRIVEFVNKVRLRFRVDDSGIYNRFLGVLNLYRKGCDRDEARVCRDVSDLFNGHSDLQQIFNALFYDSAVTLQNQGLDLCEKVKSKVADSDNSHGYLRFLKTLYEYSIGLITRIELRIAVASLVNNCPVVLDELASFLDACEENHGRRKVNEGNSVLDQISIKDSPERILDKISIQNSPEQSSLHPKRDTASSPSYRLLAEVDIPRFTQRSSLAEEVLNTNLVCEERYFGSGQEHHKSKKQEMMELWEDAYDDVHMLLELARCAATCAQKQWEILRNGTKPCSYKVRFSNISLRCIKKMYEEEGECVVGLMHKDPLRCIPVIVLRLRQKEREWSYALEDLTSKKPTTP